jgi:hypothetical protein
MHDKELLGTRQARQSKSPCFLAWLLLTLAGCSGSLPDVAPVRGVVTIDGKPLPTFKNAAVIFTPKQGRTAKSVISPANGSFELTTYETGDGARIGTHAVAVSATVEDRTVQTEKAYPGVRSVIPEKFADRDRSGLVFEVKPGGNVVEIQLRSNGTGAIVAK